MRKRRRLHLVSGGVTRTVAATSAFEAISVALPHGEVTIHADSGVEIEELRAETYTAAQG